MENILFRYVVCVHVSTRNEIYEKCILTEKITFYEKPNEEQKELQKIIAATDLEI